MGFQNLDIKTEYRSLIDDVVKDFYVPILKESVMYRRAVGFFSSSALIELTKGICGLIENGGKIQLVASPHLSDEDIEAIENGYDNKDNIIEKRLIESLREPQNNSEEERLNLLSNLIAAGKLELRIALLDNGDSIGMFHEKMGLMYDNEGNIIAYAGSMNESSNAFSHNYESFDVYSSWTYDSGRVASKEAAFNALWDNYEPNVKTIEFPKLEKEILYRYKRNDDIDLQLDKKEQLLKKIKNNQMIQIPLGVELKEYQKDAINRWVDNRCSGIFDMATGTGKTFTALGALETFESKYKSIAVFVVCPYIHLVNQWEEDAFAWGIESIIAHSESSDKHWERTLTSSYKRFRSTGRNFFCITTNDTWRSETMQSIVTNITEEMNVVLVIDEVHNFGANHLSKLLPVNIKYRLGLSATVERYGDKKGTQSIMDYFGEKCIEYPLEKAIAEKSLVEYEYYPILISLLPEELEEYQKLTKQLAKNIESKNGKTRLSKIGQQILFKRSRLIAGAEEKLPKLYELMDAHRDESHILVYCGATRGFETIPGEKERQIDRVEKMLGKELGMSTHRFTSEENMKTRKLLKEGFADGDYQVITAIKCLDEGVNIPNIHMAFILASSRNPKEFIQRRGRVLRKAPNKFRAIIYDLISLPRDLNSVRFGDFEEDRALVIGELARVFEFGRYSINSRVADQLIDDVKATYGIEYINNEDLGKMMEGEYGEN